MTEICASLKEKGIVQWYLSNKAPQGGGTARTSSPSRFPLPLYCSLGRHAQTSSPRTVIRIRLADLHSENSASDRGVGPFDNMQGTIKQRTSMHTKTTCMDT